jgi:hypothetical protein
MGVSCTVITDMTAEQLSEQLISAYQYLPN